MISNFQRFIHRHRTWMFILLLALFLLPFIFMDYWGVFRWGGDPRTMPHVVYGRKISAREFEVQKRLSRLTTQRANLRESDLDALVLKRLALAEKARQMGIVITDTELRDEIQQLPYFQTNGKFDINQYDKIIQNNIVPRGISEEDFGNMIRQDKQIQKLREVVTSTAKVSAQEASSFANDVLEKISAGVCKFDSADFTAQVHPTDEDLKQYYSAHAEQFKTPEKISVKYVFFPNEENAVQVSAKEIEDYYNENKAQFTTPDGKAKDLKSVSDTIKKQLAHQKAAANASQKAVEFSTKLVPKNSEKPVSFEDLAKSYQVQPVQTGFFSETDKIPGVSESQFVSECFSLTKEYPVSNPIGANNGVYIAVLREKQESTAIPFEQAKESVKNGFVRENAMKLARTTGEQKRHELQDLISKGQSFEQAAAALKLKTQVLKGMGMNETPKDPLEMQVRRACSQVPTGLLTEFEPTVSGGYFAFVISREKPKPEEVARFQPEVLNYMKQHAQENVFQDFTQSVFKEAGLKDLTLPEEEQM